MTAIFDCTDLDPDLILNPRGEKVKLEDGADISIDNLVGARIKVQRRKEYVTCEASVPESAGIMRWQFELGSHSYRVLTAPHWRGSDALPPVKNLAALISECRIELKR